MNLYHVQDPDRPMWVYAEGFAKALEKWRTFVRSENPDLEPDDKLDPDGVHFVADDDEILR